MSETFQYSYHATAAAHTASYLLPEVERLLVEHDARRIFEIGCGNGANARSLSARYSIVGVEPSATGVAIAEKQSTNVRIETGSGYDDLKSRFGMFDTVLSLEVIEHLYDPRLFLKRAWDLLEPNGTLILSTPYHGYLKNLALALTGKMDAHFTSLWDGGHIKFFSERTISALLQEQGFRPCAIRKCGRVPALAKSMIVVSKKVTKP
jgi:2-polyprenyl-3-methyl-5-hydroxy-6-metoxy-1,4-benzoquinol methylase